MTVEDVTRRFAQYAGVVHSDARALLGDEWFDKMMRDKIRNLGPTPTTVYPWNVQSYLTMKEQRE